MKNIFIAFRTFFQQGKNNLIKVLSLGIGLAVGLTLIAKVYLEQSYDNFFPDADRIYIIETNFFQQGEEEEEPYPQISGAVAPEMREAIPEVESATRYTELIDNAIFRDDEKNRYKGDFIFGDTSLFDLFPRPILMGEWKEVLALPMQVMVSLTIAEKMGGIAEAVGQMIELDDFPECKLRIGGVFEDIPENSHLDFNIVISMNSMRQMQGYDGSMNWVGNDRYRGYVKLQKDVCPEALAGSIRQMQEKNQPLEEFRKSGVDIRYVLSPLQDIHSGAVETKRMSRLLSMLAFIILFAAVTNYILIVISSLVHRSKEIAISKCYGASTGNIYSKMMGETLAHLILSLLLAMGLIVAFQETIRKLLDASPRILFSWESILILGVVCLVVFFSSSLPPCYLYSRIPVAAAFRSSNDTRRFWKLGMLFIQFIAAGFLISLLVVINRQYHYMIHDNPGYEYENLAYVPMSSIDPEARQMVIDEIARMPEVEMTSTCWQLPIHSLSGNNVYLPNDERELFNIADLYDVSDGYFDLMGIPIIAGDFFRKGETAGNEVMVSRSFVEKMKLFIDWENGAIGQQIRLTEHSQHSTDFFTICGIYEDFRLGAIGAEDYRPSVIFYQNKPSDVLLIKYYHLTAETNRKVMQKLQTLLPDKEMIINPYHVEMAYLYYDARMFRDAVIMGSIVALLISLIGLIGYTNDEVNRRQKEIAIRKVNGASLLNIEKLFLVDITRIAIPALIFAEGLAVYVALQWQLQFSEKATLSPSVFLFTGIALFLLIVIIVTLNCYHAANENPAKTINS